jgi:hypothetical protein
MGSTMASGIGHKDLGAKATKAKITTSQRGPSHSGSLHGIAR